MSNVYFKVLIFCYAALVLAGLSSCFISKNLKEEQTEIGKLKSIINLNRNYINFPSANSGNAIHNFSLGDNDFILDGKPIQLISGEMHYPRIPREAWRDRIKMAKAMGLNCIGTYVFWNMHEPTKGNYDFEGNSDVAEFVKIAQEEGMWVILRPSPYVCAEWEYGGYPYWLQNEKGLIIRSKDPNYLSIYRKYILEVGKQLSPLQVHKGGNILMVQIENEYGLYGNDKEYLEINRQMFIEAGFDGILFTCDPEAGMDSGHLPGLLPAFNGEEEPNHIKDVIRKNHNNTGPFYVSEWYPAWYDWWGLPHNTVNPKDKAVFLDKILRGGISINMYMFHGGTSRAFMNGANYYEWDTPKFKPQISSYDYDAPLDEAGNPTEKYYIFRNVIQKYLGKDLPPVPPKKPSIAVESVSWKKQIDLNNLIQSQNVTSFNSTTPLTFESLNQDYGFVLYRTTISNYTGGLLNITDLRDYAVVLVNGESVGNIDRMKDQNTIVLKRVNPGKVVLDLLVENLGRINFGEKIDQNLKGITDSVSLNNSVVLNWTMFKLPFKSIDDYKYTKSGNIFNKNSPVLRVGSFNAKSQSDTYLDLSNWGKGVVFVNGHNLGRYWKKGPQQTIYLPGEWLKAGQNEIAVFELLNYNQIKLAGIKTPILDKINIENKQKQ